MNWMFGRAAIGALAMVGMAVATPAAAQQQDSAKIEELRRRVDALTREIESMRLGQDVVPSADSAAHGLGPAASKVYRVRQGVSIGGYGEMVYENFAKENESDALVTTRDQIDALRLIMYLGYKFNEKWLFNSEIEYEHASTGQGGEVAVEFAYVDYVPSDLLGFRAGMVLVPVGLINELHEPPIFLGTSRPVTETVIIPSTWRENGAGVFGSYGDLEYRAYVINGLDAVGNGPSRAGGFGAGGLRGGRQKGARALIENPALVARVDYSPESAIRGLLVGASVYTGGSAQNPRDAQGVERELEVGTTIVEAHGQYQANGLDLRALYAAANLDDVAELNALRNLTGTGSVGESLKGWYVQAGYDVLRFTGSSHQLLPYVRYENVNTQSSVPTGFAPNRANERTITLIGAQWKPIPNIAFKADYQIHSNKADTGLNQFNVALGYLF